MSQIERCDGSSECQAAEHIEGCFATTKRHAQRSRAERYAGPTLEQQFAGAVGEIERLRSVLGHVINRVVSDGDSEELRRGIFETGKAALDYDYRGQ
jgi:predicted nuclease with TOPRIM domain